MRAKISFLILFISSFSCFAQNNIYTDKDYVKIAEFYQKDNEYLKAVSNYQKALKINPNNLDALLFFAMEHEKNGKYAESLHCFEKLISLNVKSSYVFFSLGLLLHKRFGRVHEAINEYVKAVKTGLNAREVHYVLRNAYFQVGDFKKGFEQDNILNAFLHKKEDKVWDGSDPNGKTILFYSDKGIGDLFMWLRYMRDLKAQGARIVVQSRGSVIPLLSRCEYIDKLVPRNVPYNDFDFKITVNKAPYFFNRSVESFCTEIPYMYAHPKLVQYWTKKLAHDASFKVGICWDPCASYISAKTGKSVKNDRAIPLCYFEPLSRIQGVSLYSLQQVNGIEQLKNISKDFAIHVFDENFDKSYGSFSDTAAVMKQLDLVITADTSVAHLAGAMGVPVWVVLPFYTTWRWFLKRSDTPWYPTMRLFRADNSGDWGPVMEQVYCELSNIVNMD